MNIQTDPRHLKREKGQGLAEYALILVLVAVVVIVVLALLGPGVKNVYSRVVCAIDLSNDFYGADISETGSGMVVTVFVRKPTTISISGDLGGGGYCAGPSCTYTFGSVSSPGTAEIKGASGHCIMQASW